MEAIILAGGRGERLKPLTNKIPKPLIKIGKKPLLEHQIVLLVRSRIKKIWILSGHLGEKIKDYFGDGGKWGVSIQHLIEKEPLGTAGAVGQLDGKVSDDFLVFSGDVVFDIDLNRFIKFHKKHRDAVATIVVHPNDHPFDSDLVEVDDHNRVGNFLIRRDKTHSRNMLFRNLTNAGIFIFSPKIFRYIKNGERPDLEKDVFPLILKSGGKIFAYNTPEYIKDMGTLERLKKARRDFDSGKIAKLNLKNKRRAIFLDRDGTINEKDGEHDVGFADFCIFPFAAEAIKRINQSNFLSILVTNQPAIAKGFMTIDELEQIHKRLETDLGWQGAKIDAIYFCPHHPERGFEGEVPELKINCACRKPKIGLIKRAVGDFNIDLSKSFFIGDSTIDAKCAQNAHIKFIGVETGQGMSDAKYKVTKNIKVYKSLLEAINSVQLEN